MKTEVLGRKVRTRKGSSTGNGFLTTRTVKRQHPQNITMAKKLVDGFFGKVIRLSR